MLKMRKISKSRFIVSFEKTFEDYCSVSSVHGMKVLKDKATSKYFRIFWALIIIAMIFFAHNMASTFYKGFYENPVRMVIETDHAIAARVYFPALTVCPGTLFNHTKAVRLFKNFTYPKGLTEKFIWDNLNQIYAFTEPRYKPSYEKIRVLENFMKLNNFTLAQFLSSTTWDCGQFFFRCRFQSKNVNCSEMFRINKSHAGFCCAFNSQQTRGRRQEYRSNIHGLRQGFSIIFNDVTFDADQIYSNSQVFQLLIHRPNAYPDDGTYRKFLHRNEEILLRYDPVETTYSEQVWNRLNIDERNCSLLSETRLQLFDDYNRQNCNVECTSQAILKLCGCVPYNLFAPPNTLVCDFQDIACLTNNRELINSRKNRCKCPERCQRVEYVMRLMTGKLEKTVDVADPFYDGFHENLTVVHIFLSSQEYRRIRRDIVWNIVSLAGNLGNCYSVFVGISALSIFELVYYLTFVFARNYKNNPNSKKEVLFKRRPIATFTATKSEISLRR